VSGKPLDLSAARQANGPKIFFHKPILFTSIIILLQGYTLGKQMGQNIRIPFGFGGKFIVGRKGSPTLFIVLIF
jgi:hypothetical protein